MSPWPLLGVVLAGGRSSRMGRDKAQLQHPSGTSFLQYTIDLLRPLCVQVVVSTAGKGSGAPDAAGLPTDVGLLADPVAGLGPAVGVAAAVAAAARRSLAAALVVPVDMPALTAVQLRALIAAHCQLPDRLVAARFADQDRCEPLLAVYPVCFADALQRLTTTEHRSLRRWLSDQPVQQVVLPAAAGVNLNTPAQLADFERHRFSE